MVLSKDSNKEKHQFRTHYCLECKQTKPCGILSSEHCCSCFYHQERENAQEYSSQKKTLADRQKKQETKIKQLQLLKSYPRCPWCGSKKVDAFELYENSQLVCQPCLVSKEGGASSSVSFLGQQKWYKKFWKIDLEEWLTNNRLPINANCAKKWSKDSQHLNNCSCLEQEAREIYELFTNSLQETEEKLRKCACKRSKKLRIDSDYYAWCEICEKTIAAASKKRVIKNRNDPKFWGLECKEKVLCGECLEARKTAMKPLRRAEFNRYRKVGRL